MKRRTYYYDSCAFHDRSHRVAVTPAAHVAENRPAAQEATRREMTSAPNPSDAPLAIPARVETKL